MKLNLRTILVMVIAITSLSVIFNTIFPQTVLIFVALLLNILINPSRHKMQRVYHRVKLLSKVIITLMIFQILFRSGGEILWQWKFIQISEVGLQYGVSSSLRLLLIVLVAGMLFDIPYYDYLLAFRSWKIPYEISFLVATVIHFIPIFGRQFKRSREALFLRGIELGRLPVIKRMKAYISLLFPVVARAVSEVRYRAISLELRAFRLYPTRTYLYQQKLKWWDWVVQVVTVVIFVNVIVFF